MGIRNDNHYKFPDVRESVAQMTPRRCLGMPPAASTRQRSASVCLSLGNLDKPKLQSFKMFQHFEAHPLHGCG